MSNEKLPVAVAGGLVKCSSIDEMYRFAEAVSKAGITPDAYRGKPMDVMVAWQYGAEVGFSPMQSLHSVTVIKGRATLSAESMRSLVMGSGLCRNWQVGYEGEGDSYACVIRSRRRNMDTDSETRFSVGQAKRAKLSGDNWSKWLDDMLLARATSRHCRTFYPDVIRGLHGTEEMTDTLPPDHREATASAAIAGRAPEFELGRVVSLLDEPEPGDDTPEIHDADAGTIDEDEAAEIIASERRESQESFLE